MKILCIAACCFSIFFSAPSFAACSGRAVGQAADVLVEISDGGCSYPDERIQVWRDTLNSPDQVVPLSQECSWKIEGALSALSCKKSGTTVLAGTEYKVTSDTNPNCFGEKAGKRLTCVRGCGKAPKYLYYTPYEC